MDEKRIINISLDNFQEYLCLLNYYKDFEEENDIINVAIETDENAKKIEETKEIKEIDRDLYAIPMSFYDAKEYIKIWQSLFFLEAKAQILKAKILEGESPEPYLLSEAESKNNFSYLKFVNISDYNPNYAYHDLVVLSPHEESNKIENEHLIGIVESNDSNVLRVRVVIKINKDDGFEEQYNRYRKLYPFFSKNSKWFIQKICNVVTLDREYQALYSIYDLHLKEIILDASQNSPRKLNKYEYFSIPEKLEEKLKLIYNESQIEAIKETLKKEGITLIQGPPGTGKTTTVLGTISVLLNSSNELIINKKNIDKKKKKIKGANKTQNKKIHLEKMQPWLYEKDFKDWRDDFEEDRYLFRKANFFPDASITDKIILMHSNKTRKTAPPEKILICAPSNAAIDEIVRKILEKGLLDSNGNRIEPYLVRIGPNVDRSLEHVSLDYLVEKEIQSKDIKQEEIQNIKNDIIKKSKIVCGTLSSAGSQILLANPQSFDTVIIDEAAQGIEISTLIPLKYGCRRLILIGDPQQLPATIFSKKCEKYKYDLSLFERLQQSNYPVYLLKIQYRMHPNISKYISDTFYKSEIKDAEQIMSMIGNPPFYSHKGFQPFIFFHVEGYENFVKNSFKNELESAFIVNLYENIKKLYPEFNTKKIGVISPYSQQVVEIRQKISQNDESISCNIEVNTVDGFQGREKDFIIFSTVRSRKENEKKGEKVTIGFLNDSRRMNVSLSRARLSLILVGNAKRLMISKIWKKLITFSIEMKTCYHVKAPLESFFQSLNDNPDEFLINSLSKLKKN